MTAPTTRPSAFVRPPAVAGMFYPAGPEQCRSAARALLRRNGATASDAPAAGWRGAVVPHAGWVCSGAIAGEAIAAMAGSRGRPPDVVVVFGAIHTPLPTRAAVLAGFTAWRQGGAELPVATEVGAKLLEGDGLFETDDRFHRHEHAIEVELPLVDAAWPGVTILPVEVPALDDAAAMGRVAARRVTDAGLDAVFLASSDLTHYGPAYGFVPAGVGPSGLAWAKDNDRRLLDRVVAMQVDAVVTEAREHLNACGAGAIAAMLAACEACGASTARLLRHANSFETLAVVAPQPPVDAVGYAAVVVG